MSGVELLRFATAGSVDDGKSTLIGRLLYDSKALMADQIEHVEDVSRRRGSGYVDLSLVTDGLRAEREQGITIDVAYRYFATPRRRFIIADTPGHAQYTRNMVTGASTADVALILVDARNGITEQSRRHAAIAALLRVPSVVVCLNKMDLVGFSEEAFDAVVREFAGLAQQLDLHDLTFVPLSALHGDNVVVRSARTPWYAGPPLLEYLETVQVARDPADEPARLPVQYALGARYAGHVASGVLRRGEEVVVLPSGRRARIAELEDPDGPVEEAFAPMAVTVALDDDAPLARGDVLAPVATAPAASTTLTATVCWMAERPLRTGEAYVVKHETRVVPAEVEEILDRRSMVTLEHEPAAGLALNDIGRVRLRLAEPLAADPFAVARATGSFILIDEQTNDTVGAGMIAAGDP